MKKAITTFLILVLITPYLIKTSYAQEEPKGWEGFMYQAELRNEKGRTLSNTSVLLDIRILDHNSVADTADYVWQRNYDVTTDKYGMISVIVGDEDTQQVPPFSSIEWGTNTLYLHVSVDDGSGWVSMGDPVILMSVPYALYAKSAGSADDTEFSSSPAFGITEQNINDWNEKSYINLNFFYADRDGDGFGDKWNVVFSDAPPHAGFISNGDDCNDEDATINPDAVEIPEDGIDQNCDGIEVYLDKDDDGYASDVDCDDDNPEIHPGATEICWDGIDNNCDGNLDEECVLDCKAELKNLFDCVDKFCGGLADLTCINSNCGSYLTTYNLCVDMACVISISGSIDENWTSEEKADFILSHCSIEDADNDGVAIVDGDCDDNDASIYPGAEDICEDEIDQDCSGTAAVCGDNDGDGFASIANGGNDCDDTNPEIYPGAEEFCDGVDNDCDGNIDNLADNPEAREYTYYEDADGDDFGNPEVYVITCNPPLDYVQNSDDCDDTNAEIFPGQIWYPDCDNDGYFSQEGIISCDVPALPCTNGEYTGEFNHVSGDDCDDEDATVHPGAEEICGNGIDDDCDGQIDEGFDYDTDVNNCGDCGEICGPGWAWICVAGQCEALDTDGDNVPDILEDVNGNNDPWDDDTDDDGLANIEDDDDDGDGILTFEEVNWTGNGEPGNADYDELPDYLDDDSDNDGFKAGGIDVSYENIDCNDWDERINPAAVEICNGYDDNCDGTTDEGCVDADGDTYKGIDGDCDDNDPTIYPGAQEICDGKDNNCNEVIDDINPIQNTCGSASNLGEISGDSYSPVMNQSGNGDKWFRILVTENSGISINNLKILCNLSFPNNVNYDIELYSACNGEILAKSAVTTPGASESVSNTWIDFPGSDQTTEMFIHIIYASGEACASWNLQILGNQ